MQACVTQKIVNANVRPQKMHVKKIYFATFLMESVNDVLDKTTVAQKIRSVTWEKGDVQEATNVSKD